MCLPGRALVIMENSGRVQTHRRHLEEGHGGHGVHGHEEEHGAERGEGEDVEPLQEPRGEGQHKPGRPPRRVQGASRARPRGDVCPIDLLIGQAGTLSRHNNLFHINIDISNNRKRVKKIISLFFFFFNNALRTDRRGARGKWEGRQMLSATSSSPFTGLL